MTPSPLQRAARALVDVYARHAVPRPDNSDIVPVDYEALTAAFAAALSPDDPGLVEAMAQALREYLTTHSALDDRDRRYTESARAALRAALAYLGIVE